MSLKIAPQRRVAEAKQRRSIGSNLFAVFMVSSMLPVFSAQALAVDTIWTKASEIMNLNEFLHFFFVFAQLTFARNR